MILTPLLRKTVTALLALPIGIAATSSHADCASAARAPVETYETASIEYGSVPELDNDSHEVGKPSRPVKGARLSRTAFYGDEVGVAIDEL